ncbi:alpha/beta fold hydrolase [Kribbella sp. NPDC004536]|uniref:alpha/beta fold hydrolase n=1 Tax=Kribbella sp. NPDC004536 TaxID=3364106 RepID=UPI0036BDBBBC
MTTPAPAQHPVLRQIDTPYGRIAATTTNGEGPPVVLLHGFPDDQRIYTRLLSALAPRAATAFDFVGYGRSGRPVDQSDSESDSQAHLGQISAVLDGLDAERAILVGHDGSGPDAVRFALAEPDRVERVVLLNTTFGQRKSLIMPEMTRLLAQPELASLADDMLADQQQRLWLLTRWGVQWELDSDPDGIRATSIAPQLYGSSEQPDALAAIRHWTSDWLESLAAQETLVDQGALRRLDVPVSVIFGENDRYLGPDLAAELAGLFGAASLDLVQDAGHYPQHDQPEHVAAIINNQMSAGSRSDARAI